jgi:exodeoxyribonuclease VII large subunit
MLFLDAPSMFSVSQLSRYLKEVLDTDDILQDVWVRGEISGCKLHAASGHCYFTLKDADAQLACVFFKPYRLHSAAPQLRDGMAIAANGHISFYERDGKLQLYVERVEPIGDGALFQRFSQLKARLEAEGLFEEDRKRPLPPQPSVIGIVTSPQAAALQDMLRVLAARYPLARVILSPASVQGAEAPLSIANALDLLNQHGEADVIIVGRGGGSVEELWAFNEEVVARAIARSRIPVISGVGHETDFTISDFVADQRASTPTAAATAAVPDIADWRESLAAYQDDLAALMQAYFDEKLEALEEARRDLARFSPQSQLDRLNQRLDDTSALLQERMDNILARRVERLRGMELLLDSLSPKQTVNRGYAIVRRGADKRIVTSVEGVQPGENLTIQVRDGDIQTTVQTIQTISGGRQ